MYGAVLMAALVAGGESTGCKLGHGRHCGHRGQPGGYAGGCYGGGYGGCYGGGYGGGYGGCYGGCYGGGYHSSYITSAGGCAVPPAMPPMTPLPPAGTAEEVTNAVPPAAKDKEGKPQSMAKRQELQTVAFRAEKDRPGQANARLVFDLAPSARLYINGVFYETRTFRTPALESGKPYHYVARAEVVRDGKVESETQYVAVEPGKEITVTFTTFKPLIARK